MSSDYSSEKKVGRLPGNLTEKQLIGLPTFPLLIDKIKGEWNYRFRSSPPLSNCALFCAYDI
jgi:hypothetical protein